MTDTRVWTGPLDELWMALQHEALALRGQLDRGEAPPHEGWSYYRLPRGAVVALRVLGGKDFPRRELRISRATAPADEAGRKAWEVERLTFQKYFTVRGSWHPIEVPQKAGVVAAYRELLPGEQAPRQARCTDCGNPIPYDPAFPDTDRCAPCALQAGRPRDPAPTLFR